MFLNNKKNFLVIFFLGISSGIPITLILSTLKALLVDKGFDLQIIGFLSLVSLPYSLKIFVIYSFQLLSSLTIKKLGSFSFKIISVISFIKLFIINENSSVIDSCL